MIYIKECVFMLQILNRILLYFNLQRYICYKSVHVTVCESIICYTFREASTIRALNDKIIISLHLKAISFFSTTKKEKFKKIKNKIKLNFSDKFFLKGFVVTIVDTVIYWREQIIYNDMQKECGTNFTWALQLFWI